MRGVGKDGFVLWFTGVPGAGKSTLAELLKTRLVAAGAKVEVLDGDTIRTGLSRGLGFSKEDRDENIRRIGFVAEVLSRNGVTTIVAAISPYRAAREQVRAQIDNFVEVHLTCPLDVLLARDPRGLYQSALTGEIPRFTGISDPYEPPLSPDITIDSSTEKPEESAERIWAVLKAKSLVPHRRRRGRNDGGSD